SAGSLGIIIPPSIPMIMYGVSSQTSVGDMFLGGILPGILIGIGMIIWVCIYSKKKGFGTQTEKFTFKRFFVQLNHAKWALLTPIIILGGIYSGMFTPTEAAVISVVYAILISLFVYKEISVKDLPRIVSRASLTSASVLIIISAATAFGKVLTLEQIPNQVAGALTTISDSSFVIILLIMIMLLVVGMFMDTTAAVVILTPILFPVAVELGIHPVHFGVMMIANLAIGFITPPLGVNLFVGSGISGVGIPTLSRAVTPFLISMIITLIFIVVFPFLSLVLL
ncbi:TRAP transporter large permease, partial [Gracilibacillus oryzae]